MQVSPTNTHLSKIHISYPSVCIINVRKAWFLPHFKTEQISRKVLIFSSPTWVDCLLHPKLHGCHSGHHKVRSEWELVWWASPWERALPTQETWVQSLGQEDPLEKEMTTHSSILVWEISWAEEPGGLQSMGSQRVTQDLATKTTSNHVVASLGLLLVVVIFIVFENWIIL